MDLSWTVDRAGDVSLVRCRVHNDDAVSRRVRVESRFDAPVLPPRRAGVPENGWDATGVTLRIGPGERRGFGFAAPSPPVEPPVTVASVEPVDSAESACEGLDPAGGESAGSTAAAALRELGDHRPPRAAVDGGRGADGDRTLRRVREADEPRDDDLAVPAPCDSDGGRRGAGERGRAAPESIDEWFAAVEARIDRAERLTDADVETATAVVADAGGVDALADLDEGVAEDAERLRAVSERAASLAERAAATDVPVGALERFA